MCCCIVYPDQMHPTLARFLSIVLGAVLVAGGKSQPFATVYWASDAEYPLVTWHPSKAGWQHNYLSTRNLSNLLFSLWVRITTVTLTFTEFVYFILYSYTATYVQFHSNLCTFNVVIFINGICNLCSTVNYRKLLKKSVKSLAQPKLFLSWTSNMANLHFISVCF